MARTMQRARETRAHGGECEMRRWLAQRPYTNTEQSTAAEAREEMFRACAPRRSEIFACLGREAAERAAVFVVALGVWALDRCSCASFMLFVAPRVHRPASSFIAHRASFISCLAHRSSSRIAHRSSRRTGSCECLGDTKGGAVLRCSFIGWCLSRVPRVSFISPSSLGLQFGVWNIFLWSLRERERERERERD